MIKAANPSVGLNSLHDWDNGQYKKSTVLPAWKGAFVYADNGGTVSFPVTSRTTSSGRILSNELPISIDEDAWQLPITLSFQDLVQTSSVGMHPLASESKDKYDDITVPRFIDYLEMHTLHPEFKALKFSDDIVPTNNQRSWLFTLSSNLEDGTAKITWDSESLAKSQSQIMLIDLTDQKWMDMKAVSNYAFNWKNTRQVKIAYARLGDIDPGVTFLGQAYPNPFSTQVSIPVLVSSDNLDVRVDVFDLMGRKVKSIFNQFLNPGHHELLWDGKDDQDHEVSNGVLLYRIENDHRSKRIIKQ
jgi:hypothetical protein